MVWKGADVKLENHLRRYSWRIDHDRLFKELLTTFFPDFVNLLLPELAAYLDATSLEFLDQEVFTDVRLELKVG